MIAQRPVSGQTPIKRIMGIHQRMSGLARATC